MTAAWRHLALGLLCLLLAPLPASGGDSITLVVRDAPLAEVYEMLSRKEQVNVLLGKGVEGSVSVNLFEVSLDDAIRSIADAAGYVAERRRMGYVIIKRDEAGKDFANANTVIRAFKVEYSDPKIVSEIVENHLSRYGEVKELEDRRLIIVEDLPEFVDRVERLLAEIDQDPRQILIEARILEIKLDDEESWGIDWSHTFSPDGGSATIGVRDLALKATPGFFFDLMTSDIEVAITALAQKGRVRTLSTPTLLALEHQEAEVVVGDRLGFRVTTTVNQVTTESVEFLESGVILRFTASVDRSGRIVLKIHPEVSTGVISDGLPSQTTAEVTTRLVTEDGQRIFIGGLIKNRETRDRKGIPYVMDIPILGWAFRQETQNVINTETVVILTAHLVDDRTPLLAAGRAKLTAETEVQLEQKRQEMEGYFEGPSEPAGDEPKPIPAAPSPEPELEQPSESSGTQ